MRAGAAALLVLVAGTAPAASGEQECPDFGDAPSPAWSAQSRSLLSSHVRYPLHAASNGITGTARLQIEVDREGRIHGVSIAASSGEPVLDQAALDAARATGRFPALPCLPGSRIRVIIPVRFALSD